MDLTLTRVVFESDGCSHIAPIKLYLTLTRVVFEWLLNII